MFMQSMPITLMQKGCQSLKTSLIPRDDETP